MKKRPRAGWHRREGYTPATIGEAEMMTARVTRGDSLAAAMIRAAFTKARPLSLPAMTAAELSRLARELRATA